MILHCEKLVEQSEQKAGSERKQEEDPETKLEDDSSDK